MVRADEGKYLILLEESATPWLEAEILGKIEIVDKRVIVKCATLTHQNLTRLTEFFSSLLPSPAGFKKSFGTGDRLGIATPAHIQAFEGKNIFPVLAQQSVRENTRTGKNFQKVLDNAMWGCFQAGYEGGFGADADHVKKLENLKEAVDCGYTMFTVDPSGFVRDDIFELTEEEKNNLYTSLPARKRLERRYLGKSCVVAGKKLQFDKRSLRDICLTYYEALQHAINCYKFLDDYKRNSFDFEVSVDETLLPTSFLAHIFIAQELHREEVEFQSLALRFAGDWQKGIDYIGDVEEFSRQLYLHTKITEDFGGYKLSLHSGSDKFSVYPVFAEKTEGRFHVKTSGTSYVEAMRVIAKKEPSLYRQIHNFALEKFDKDKASYHTRVDFSRIPDIDKFSDRELESLLEKPDLRQLIHVTYGSVLSVKEENNSLFRDRIYEVLFKYEKEHQRRISSHIDKHLKLLGT